MLTLFHGEQFCDKISTIELDEETKNSFKKLVNGFLNDLFELTGFKPSLEMRAQYKETIKGAQEKQEEENVKNG